MLSYQKTYCDQIAMATESKLFDIISHVEAMDKLEAAGYSHLSFFVNRHRRDVPMAQARTSLIA